MSGVSGTYVDTFEEASHALPEGMHMNADYPFMTPKIIKLKGRSITLRGRGGIEETFRVVNPKKGRDYCVVRQKSSFENLYNRPPTAFRCYPFKDRDTDAIGES